MIAIAICDDDRASRSAVRHLCETILDQEGTKAVFYEYPCAESLLIDYPDPLDIIFLDVVMGDLDGISASREIRKHDTAVTLVFMSSYPQYALEGYAVQAYRYLLKPINPPQFASEMRGVFSKLERDKSAKFTVHNEEGLFAIVPRDTKYIETASGKNVRLHLLDSSILCRGTLKQWEESFKPHGFFRCHSSYLVNLAYVKTIRTEGVVVLADGEELPVSRHRRKEFMSALASFVRGRI